MFGRNDFIENIKDALAAAGCDMGAFRSWQKQYDRLKKKQKEQKERYERCREQTKRVQEDAQLMEQMLIAEQTADRKEFGRLLKIHQFAIMCAPTTSQYAAIEALRHGDDDVEKMRDEYDRRRRFLLNAFEEMGIECFEPYGAFYMFPSIKKFGMSSDEFATRLLKEEKIAVVPGTAFGDCGEGFLRISYAYSIDDLKAALERIERFIEKL